MPECFATVAPMAMDDRLRLVGSMISDTESNGRVVQHIFVVTYDIYYVIPHICQCHHLLRKYDIFLFMCRLQVNFWNNPLLFTSIGTGYLSLFLVSLIPGVRVATRLCRPVDDPPPLSSILGHHPPVHVLQLGLSHVSLDAIAPSHTWSSSLSLSPLLENICHLGSRSSFIRSTCPAHFNRLFTNLPIIQPTSSLSSSILLRSILFTPAIASPSCFHTPAVYVGVSRTHVMSPCNDQAGIKGNIIKFLKFFAHQEN